MVPDDALAAEAKNLAAFYAAGAPLALSAAKRLLWNTIEVERALPEEARTVSSLSATDSREGLAAVIEKRKPRSEEHTSELQSLMRISYAVFCLKKKKNRKHNTKIESDETKEIQKNIDEQHQSA